MQAYNHFLNSIEQELGINSTWSDALHQVGLALFNDKWGGVFMRDEEFPHDKYCIINTSDSDTIGEHWVATAFGLEYDSFGRPDILMLGLQDVDSDSEQDDSESNCGQRCLAWLCVYEVYGRAVAMTI